MTDLELSSIAEYVSIILKALGVSFVSSICSSFCLELGKPSLSELVQLAGKIELLILCLPLITKIVSYVSGLI